MWAYDMPHKLKVREKNGVYVFYKAFLLVAVHSSLSNGDLALESNAGWQWKRHILINKLFQTRIELYLFQQLFCKKRCRSFRWNGNTNVALVMKLLHSYLVTTFENPNFSALNLNRGFLKQGRQLNLVIPKVAFL